MSRHINEITDLEKPENSWDVMVLHYLGLDHIGHAYGSENYRIKEKLLGMDKNILHIHQALQKSVSIRKMSLLHLLFIITPRIMLGNLLQSAQAKFLYFPVYVCSVCMFSLLFSSFFFRFHAENFKLILLHKICDYASPSSGEAYRVRQLTNNFEL